MAARIQSCIGFDKDNLEWLRDRPEGMAEFINRLVRSYREKKTVQAAVGPGQEPELKSIVSTIKEERAKEQFEHTEKIRNYLTDKPYIVYLALTSRKHTKADLCRIKDELYFSKYNVEVTVEQIKKVLKEEMEKFDIESYEKAQGITRP